VTEPAEEYTRRLHAWRDRQARLERRRRRIVRARNVVLGLIVALVILAEKESVTARLALILPPALAVEGLVRWRNRTRRNIEVAGRAVRLYEDRLARLDGAAARGGPTGARFLDESHPCALDLDLFGAGSVFERLSQCRTGAGEDVLAAWLCDPAGPDEVRARQAAVAELRPDLDTREHAALLPPDDAEAIDVRGLLEWARADVDPFPPGTRLASLVLVAATLMALAGWLFLGAGAWPLLIALAAEGLFAWWLRDRAGAVLAPIKHRADELALLADLLARLREGQEASRRVGRLARLARRLAVKNDLVRAPFASALLWTTHQALAAAAWRRAWGSSLEGWLAALGKFEALHSLAGYAYDNPADPFPELLPGGPCFDGVGLGHPLLPRGRCVTNDVRLDRGLALFVVSGSNMSGKSTLLRAVGVNAVLAQAGAPVRAARLALSPLTVGATLRVQDSLRDGRSRFYAEVLRVRQLVALAAGPRPLLFLLDELFAGTNSHDRGVAAEAVLRALVGAGAIGLVTTHDLVLTRVTDLLAPRAANVHFEDRLEDGALVFDYRLRGGVAPHGNALAVLRAAGIDV
jgi:hypothetical protein